MADIKMSDVFELPLKSVEYQNQIVDKNKIELLFADFHDYEKGALIEAINTYDANQKRIKELEAQQQWISVDDETPYCNNKFEQVEVIAFCIHPNIQIVTSLLFDEKNGFTTDCGEDFNDFVTRWMLLPEPPKE